MESILELQLHLSTDGAFFDIRQFCSLILSLACDINCTEILKLLFDLEKASNILKWSNSFF